MPGRVGLTIRAGIVALVCLLAFAAYAPGIVPAFWTRCATGITGRFLTPFNSNLVEVWSVALDSPGAAAGIRRGDRLFAAGPYQLETLQASGVKPCVTSPSDFQVLVVRAAHTFRSKIHASSLEPFLSTSFLTVLALRLGAYIVIVLVCAALVLRKSAPVTWMLLLFTVGTGPSFAAATFAEGMTGEVPSATLSLYGHVVLGLNGLFAVLPLFFLAFPHPRPPAGWQRRMLPAVAAISAVVFLASVFVAPLYPELIFKITSIFIAIETLIIIVGNYFTASVTERPKLQWAFIGFLMGLCSLTAGPLLIALHVEPTFGYWLSLLALVLPATAAYTLIQRRVVSPIFALNRSFVYAVLTTLVIALLEGVHWLVSRVIENEHYAFVIEGGVAILIGIFIHRIYRGVESFTDRWLFRARHLAERHLSRVAAALSYATDRGEIDRALVDEPCRALNLASAGVFWYEAGVFVLSRAFEWNEISYALSENRDLVRYLKSERAPIGLDAIPTLERAGFPQGLSHPTLAVPIWIRHRLVGFTLYGPHANATLIEVGEIALLERLATAAATAYDHAEAEALREEVEQLRARLVPLAH